MREPVKPPEGSANDGNGSSGHYALRGTHYVLRITPVTRALRIPPHPQTRRSAGLYARPRLLFAPRRLRGAQKGLGPPAEGTVRRQKDFPPGTNPRRSAQVRPARPWRRRVLLRAQVVVRGSQERQADLPDLQRRRIGARHV